MAKAETAEKKRKQAAKASEIFAVGPGKIRPGKDPKQPAPVVRATVSVEAAPKEDGRKKQSWSCNKVNSRWKTVSSVEFVEKLDLTNPKVVMPLFLAGVLACKSVCICTHFPHC